MDMELELDVEDTDDEEEEENSTYQIDFENGRITGKIDGIKAVEQAINKMILTERYKNMIYSTDYGTEINSTINVENASDDFLETALEDVITEALLSDDRIIEAKNFEFYDSYPTEDSMTVEFDVNTIYGDTHVSTVIENGSVSYVDSI
ncbi:MAG: DUF2634 domain-containing protein [Lachnospiraceae bacterium]